MIAESLHCACQASLRYAEDMGVERGETVSGASRRSWLVIHENVEFDDLAHWDQALRSGTVLKNNVGQKQGIHNTHMPDEGIGQLQASARA